MESLRVIPDLEKQGLREDTYQVVKYMEKLTIGGLKEGTVAGKPIVMICLDMGEHFLIAETTLALFLSAADALKAKYGDPRG